MKSGNEKKRKKKKKKKENAVNVRIEKKARR